jgi:hypothetical protein
MQSLTANPQGWVTGFEPDEDQTRKRAGQILAAEGVATSDERKTEPNCAMVAPGYEGGAEPCMCGGSMSH